MTHRKILARIDVGGPKTAVGLAHQPLAVPASAARVCQFVPTGQEEAIGIVVALTVAVRIQRPTTARPCISES
jgi:uncharacterized membrane protein